MMLRVALVGLGRIARTFLALRNAEDEAHWQVVGALKRNAATAGRTAFPVVETLADLRALAPDLLIDFTGPNALKAHGADLLRLANMWTVGAAALVSPPLEQDLRAVAAETGHRLRLLPGAIGGLDLLSAMAIDPQAAVSILACTTANRAASGEVDTARAVVARNSGVNVIAAAAFASLGLDRTLVYHVPIGEGEARSFAIQADGSYGSLRLSIDPAADAGRGTILVAASAIVALRNGYRAIWAG